MALQPGPRETGPSAIELDWVLEFDPEWYAQRTLDSVEVEEYEDGDHFYRCYTMSSAPTACNHEQIDAIPVIRISSGLLVWTLHKCCTHSPWGARDGEDMELIELGVRDRELLGFPLRIFTPFRSTTVREQRTSPAKTTRGTKEGILEDSKRSRAQFSGNDSG